MRKCNSTHSSYKRMTDGKVARRVYLREGARKTPGAGTRGRWEKRERHQDNYQGFVPIVSAHSPPLALEGPELVARRRRLRRRAVRCSSSRLRFRQQQHEPTTLVILRRGPSPERDRSRWNLPVIATPGLICHPASRRTTPKYLLSLLRLSVSSGTKFHFSGDDKSDRNGETKKERGKGGLWGLLWIWRLFQSGRKVRRKGERVKNIPNRGSL